MQHQHSITDVSLEFPSVAEIWNVLTLQAGFNSAVVVIGTTLLGIAAGLVGSFALLRKRALVGDALAHATLPGIALAFILATSFGLGAKSLGVLLPGAAVTGVLGVICVQLISRHTRLEEDTAIGAVLSVFFGLGVVLLSYIQGMEAGNQGGLKSFIYGQTAAMSVNDAVIIATAAGASALAAWLLLKEFTLVCFNEDFAAVQGWPVQLIDLAMMALVVLVTVIGLQAVGLILVVAMLIIPAAAARFWTERLPRMIAISAGLGGLSGYLGASVSALLPRMPAGAVIVLTAGVLFVISMLAAPSRGVFAAIIRRVQLRRLMQRDHVLRALFEYEDLSGEQGALLPRATIAREHGLSERLAMRLSRRMERAGLVRTVNGDVALTSAGRVEAARITRNHRLWEQYLITYADIAPSHVDVSADLVEHVLAPELVVELAAALRAREALPERLPDHTERLAAEGGA